MQRLLFTAIAYATIIASVDGQDPKDSFKASEPGPEHANLKAFVGTWELTVEGVKEKGSAQIKSILGGRFITEARSTVWAVRPSTRRCALVT